MTRLRLLGLAGALCAAAAWTAAPAAARPDAGAGTAYPELLETAHFAIHYTGKIADPPNKDRIVQQAAGDLAANAERAYDLFVTQWGFPPPKNDGDGKVDVWVKTQDPGITSWTYWEESTPPSTVWLSIAPDKASDARIAAQLAMGAILAGIWYPSDTWLPEATAGWASFAATDYEGVAGSMAPPDLSLDCESDACDVVSANTHGGRRWVFFEYLSQRFGASIVKDIFLTGAAIRDKSLNGRALLAEALSRKGTTLSDVFNDFVATHVRGGYTAPGLKAAAPAFHAEVPVGLIAKALPVKRVPVNHLASRYLKFKRDTSNSGACSKAELTITVALPAGSNAKPSYFQTLDGEGVNRFMSVSGNTASVKLPWTTCSTGGDVYVGLPNPSSTADGQMFTVSGTLAVSTESAVPPSGPPPAAYGGPAVPAPTANIAPSILVHGGELVKVPAATRVVRLLVFASGDGQLRATAGDLVLGTATLRAGNNDVRFVLPVATAKSLRRIKAVPSGVLTLTSLSPEGTAGATVTRKLAIVSPPVKAAKLAKKKTKRTAR